MPKKTFTLEQIAGKLCRYWQCRWVHVGGQPDSSWVVGHPSITFPLSGRASDLDFSRLRAVLGRSQPRCCLGDRKNRSRIQILLDLSARSDCVQQTIRS